MDVEGGKCCIKFLQLTKNIEAHQRCRQAGPATLNATHQTLSVQMKWSENDELLAIYFKTDNWCSCCVCCCSWPIRHCVYQVAETSNEERKMKNEKSIFCKNTCSLLIETCSFWRSAMAAMIQIDEMRWEDIRNKLKILWANEHLPNGNKSK